MRLLGNKPWFTLVTLLVMAGFLAYLLRGSRDCALNADGTNCTRDQETVTKIRANDYYCKLVAYRDNCGSFPTTEQGLMALVKSPVTPPLCPRYPPVPFVVKAEPPKDGFGEAFAYESDGKEFRLLSPGRQRWWQQNGWASDSRGVDAGYPRAGINLCL